MLPPYCGIRLSARVMSAPCSSKRRARLDPMKPNPPVINTLLPLNLLSKLTPSVSIPSRRSMQITSQSFLSHHHHVFSKIIPRYSNGTPRSVRTQPSGQLKSLMTRHLSDRRAKSFACDKIQHG